MPNRYCPSFMKLTTIMILAGGVMSVASPSVCAMPAQTDQRLTRCLHRASDLPDIAAVESEAWIKKGGGDPAKVCHAFAQFHRGEFQTAAKEFSELAKKREKKNPKQASSLHTQAGLAAMRDNDHKTAEAEFTAALKGEPHDPDIWMDRATLRAATERYWEALADIDKSLDLMPDAPEALQLRGQIRMKLGQDNGAKADFERAKTIKETDAGQKP